MQSIVRDRILGTQLYEWQWPPTVYCTVLQTRCSFALYFIPIYMWTGPAPMAYTVQLWLKLRGTGFESRQGRMFVSEVVHIHCSNLFKGLEYAMLSMVGLLCTAKSPWSHSIRGCAYTLLQFVQRPGVCNALYGRPTVHYKEPLKSFNKSRTEFRLRTSFCFAIAVIVQKST